MGFLGDLLAGGSRHPKELTARQAYDLAKQSLLEAHPGGEAESAFLCCLYTSVMDTDAVISEDGKCCGWHLDFFLPQERKLFLVRIERGKLRTSSRAWEKTKDRPVEYVFGVYGNSSKLGTQAEPFRLIENWIDSSELSRVLSQALEPYQSPEHGEPYTAIALCLPAQYLSYLQQEKTKKALALPFPPDNSIAVICATDELYERDSIIFYLEAASARIVQTHKFRFPDLFNFGTSSDW